MTDKAEKTLIRENIEWISIRWHNAPDTDMRRGLLVGDSIVVGHGSQVHELLKDKICVDYFATAKHVTDEDYIDELEFMLAKRNYELIMFNNGLHGFDIEDDLYAPALEELLSMLKSKTPRLVWRNSTPVLDKEDLTKFNEERNPRVIRRNSDAAKIAEELGLQIIDLYTPMAENKKLFSEDAVHYTPEGQDVQAAIISEFIQAQL
jgi:hypothetical protein